jgi:drug/metabolite transporter (DMT)-like permease
MSPRDHNKTLVVLYSLVCGLLALLLCASPWIIAKNVSSIPSPPRDDQVMTAAIVTGIVIFLFLLLLSTAIGLHRRRRWDRKLALCATEVG